MRKPKTRVPFFAPRRPRPDAALWCFTKFAHTFQTDAHIPNRQMRK
eukprot:COSAG06_NODE_2711_length_6401_cov_343.215192_7_plen_46_part_00